MILSICIPTYNRPEHLLNCLSSLSLQSFKNFEVCISDNASDKNIRKLISPFKKKLKIKFNRNKKNLGFALNLLKVSSMAKGEFIWFIGDDDLLVKDSLKNLIKKITQNKDVDFFWVNSFYLDVSHLKKFSKPFNIKNLPNSMIPHSKLKKDRKTNFFGLIDKEVSFDYLLGIFVCVFRRKKWEKNLHVIDRKKIKDKRTWSNFENTVFFIKVFTEAFSRSKAYICAKPLSVNLYGVREWLSLYPFVEIVRIPEALDFYRSKGLSFTKYIVNKNYALRNFFNFFVKILITGKKGGLAYVDFKRNFLYNLIYPNAWMSILYFFCRKLRNIIISIINTFNIKHDPRR